MMERSFFESEAAIDYVSHAFDLAKIDDDPGKWLSSLPAEQVDVLNDELLKLTREDLSAQIASEQEATIHRTDRGFGLRFRTVRDQATGEPTKMRFFRVTQSWKSMALALAALAWSVLAHTLPIFPVIGICRTIWENLIKLDATKDKPAISAYEAVLKARKSLEEKNSPAWPTLTDVQAQMAAGESALEGLLALQLRGLVAVAEWGGAPDKFQTDSNRWKITW